MLNQIQMTWDNWILKFLGFEFFFLHLDALILVDNSNRKIPNRNHMIVPPTMNLESSKN